MLESKLEEAGQGKKSKEQLRAERARKLIIDRVLGDPKKPGKKQYADPALLF